MAVDRQPSHDTTRRGKHMNISHLAFASMIATVLYSFAFVIQSALNIIIQSDSGLQRIFISYPCRVLV